MTDGRPDQDPGQVSLVPGELRGYRQFELRADGLYPLVHTETGAWSGEREHAVCAVDEQHQAPVSGCTCGLYAWYLPGSATVPLGYASAVIAASGRCILADRGFRAAAARIEAVTLPGYVAWNPWALRRARRLLHDDYPGAVVYRSSRQMLKDHPPDDVTSLGISPPRDRSRGYRSAVVALSALVMVPTYALFFLPRDAMAQLAATFWPLFVGLVVLWQTGLVWLLSRLLTLQQPPPARPTSG